MWFRMLTLAALALLQASLPAQGARDARVERVLRGLRPAIAVKGDRILTWSPSSPALPAVYFGAMRAGLILVPLDLRMSADAIRGIVGVACREL